MADIPIKKGEQIYFGNYQIVKNGAFYPLLWRIIFDDGEKVQMVCENILDYIIFDRITDQYYYSYVRKWLNSDFFKTCFSIEQRKHMLATNGDYVLLASETEAKNIPACNRKKEEISFAKSVRGHLPESSIIYYYSTYNRDKYVAIIPVITIKKNSIGLYGVDGAWPIDNPFLRGSGMYKPKLTAKGNVTFGNWYKGNGKKGPILWEIKSEIDDTYVLVAKRVIDYREYHSKKLGYTKYKDTDLRYWLNHDFFYGAFNEEEQESIAITKVFIESDNEYIDDYVYLLTEKQVKRYYTDPVKYSTPYIFELTNDYGPNYEGKECKMDYWLRNYFEWDTWDRSSFSYVNYEGTICHRDSKTDKRGVVPVIRIYKKDLEKY